MRGFCVNIAVLTFFVLAGVGALGGASPWACAWRALAGACVMFMLTRIGGRIVVSIMVEAIVAKGPNKGMSYDSERSDNS